MAPETPRDPFPERIWPFRAPVRLAAAPSRAAIAPISPSQKIIHRPSAPNYIDRARKLDAGGLDKVRDPHTRVPW